MTSNHPNFPLKYSYAKYCNTSGTRIIDSNESANDADGSII